MAWRIICTCGHTFTRATICRRDLRTWDCPRRNRTPNFSHQTHGMRPVRTK